MLFHLEGTFARRYVPVIGRGFFLNVSPSCSSHERKYWQDGWSEPENPLGSVLLVGRLVGVSGKGMLMNFLLPFPSPSDEYAKENPLFSGRVQPPSFTFCSMQSSHLAGFTSLSGPLSPPEGGGCRSRHLRFGGLRVGGE